MLKLPIEQIYAGGESKARNQRIQNMLRMIGYGENIGSGFPLILSAWNEKHWIKPELIEQTELMQVKLILHVLNESDTQGVPQDDTQGDTQGLNLDNWIENEIVNNPKITTEELARLSGKSIITIKRHLAKLKHINYIGSGYSGRWEITQK